MRTTTANEMTTLKELGMLVGYIDEPRSNTNTSQEMNSLNIAQILREGGRGRMFANPSQQSVGGNGGLFYRDGNSQGNFGGGEDHVGHRNVLLLPDDEDALDGSGNDPMLSTGPDQDNLGWSELICFLIKIVCWSNNYFKKALIWLFFQDLINNILKNKYAVCLIFLKSIK